MGLLDRFRKEEKVHFVRNEDGEVTRVTRNGHDVDYKESGWKSTRQLEREYYQKHPEKRLTSRVVKAGRSFDKAVLSKMKPIDMSYSRGERGRTRYSVKNNYNPFGSMFDSGMNYNIAPIRMKKSKNKVRKFDMMDNWGFMK